MPMTTINDTHSRQEGKEGHLPGAEHPGVALLHAQANDSPPSDSLSNVEFTDNRSEILFPPLVQKGWICHTDIDEI